MQEFSIYIIIPIFTALLSYLGARHQSSKDLQKLRESQKHEIDKIKEESKYEIEKINIQMEKQGELYQQNAQTDLATDFLSKILTGDSSGIEGLEKIMKIQGLDSFKHINNPTSRKR